MNRDIIIWRKGKFQYKQVVTKLLEGVIVDAIGRAEDYIQKTGWVTFNYGELQMHSIIVPSIVERVDSFILEYPIIRKRGRKNHYGRSDYYCRCNMGQRNEYQLFIELKSGRQGLPCKDIRKQNKEIWNTACAQIKGIEAEIKRNKAFYAKPVIRVCMETLALYADKSKIITKEDIEKVFTYAQSMSETYPPNLIILWRCADEIRKLAKDEWHDGRQMFGMIFVCHIMEQINIHTTKY